MPVNGSVTSFEVFSRYRYQYSIKILECVEIIFDFTALNFDRKYGIILQMMQENSERLRCDSSFGPDPMEATPWKP